MLKENITPLDVCNLLNEMLALDKKCVSALFSSRVICNNKKIADHTTIQVMSLGGDPQIGTVGILGILNGLFGIKDNGFGAMFMEYEYETGEIIRFGLTDEVENEKNR